MDWEEGEDYTQFRMPELLWAEGDVATKVGRSHTRGALEGGQARFHPGGNSQGIFVFMYTIYL